jgi:hypothetical protein
VPRQLYFHIGTHKTGTTSLQRYLLDHREALRDRGLGVATETGPRGRTTANCDGVADTVLRPSLLTGARSRGRFPPPGRRRGYTARLRSLRAEVKDLGTPRVLVSAEGLCFARAWAESARVRAMARACGATPITIVCLRDVEQWRASWNDQLVKIEYPGSFSPTDADDIRADWYFDHAAIVAFWSRLGEVRTIDYGTATAEHGSVIPAVVAATDTDVVPSTGHYELNRRRTTG